ncbi:MAG: terpene synthase family protein [Rhabdochlamydiaceae bacterium]
MSTSFVSSSSPIDLSLYARNYEITAAEVDSATKISSAEEEVDDNNMWDVTLREFKNLYCPFQWKINEHKDAAAQATDIWSKEYGFPPCAKNLPDLLMAGNHPDCPDEMLLAFICLGEWVFVYDDKVERKLCNDPEKLKELNQKNSDVLRGKLNAMDGDDILTKAMDNLREKFEGISKPEWRARFIKDMEDYFEANYWESAKTKEGRIPEMEEYLNMRLRTGAVYLMFALCELAAGVEISDEVFNDRYVQALRESCNKWIFLSNDIISYPKEAKGTGNNIIHIFMAKEGCSLGEAIAKTRDLCNAEMGKILDLIEKMPSSYTENEKKYFNELVRWLISSKEWSERTPRYKKPIPKDLPMFNQKV